MKDHGMTALSIRLLMFKCIVFGLVMTGFGLASPAWSRDPLLVPGKHSLFQRVLTRPQVPMTSEAGGGQPIATLPPFEIFYVYGEKHIGETAYVEVGRSLQRGSEGWMKRNDTINWKQSIVLGFNNPAGRQRALIFKTRQELEATLAQEDVSTRLDQLRRDASSGSLHPLSPIISIEPSEHIDIEREFYVLPILQSESVRLPTSIRAQLLEIASVPKNRSQSAAPRNAEQALRDFRVGVTFVIDTTKSMQPSIEEIRKAMEKLRDAIADSPQAEHFRFGLVAFRDNISVTPGLEYVTKTYLPLNEQATAERFVQAITQIKASDVSSEGYDEDSIAGIQAAADLDWEPFGGRLVILVTDASPRKPGPGSAAGNLGPAELQSILQQKNIALMALHLKSQSGRFDHEQAEAAYQILSRFGNSTNYFPIENADPAVLGRQVQAVSTRLQGIVSGALQGRMADAAATRPDDISSSTDLLGRAMQLAYLGSASGTQVPDVFRGWITDADPLQRGIFPVTPYFLMSRNELSALRDVVQKAIELGSGAAQEGSSDQFFSRLQEAVALMGIRPEAVQDAGTLGDLLGEYLADLPYRSEIANLTKQDWRDLSPIGERELMDTLRSKLVALEKLHNDQNRWHSLTSNAPSGEYVTTVPLSLMP
jgi:serine/threonine-protein kinase PpkA